MRLRGVAGSAIYISVSGGIHRLFANIQRNLTSGGSFGQFLVAMTRETVILIKGERLKGVISQEQTCNYQPYGGK